MPIGFGWALPHRALGRSPLPRSDRD